MDVLLDLIKIVLPAALLLYAMYLTVRSFLNKQTEEKWLEIRNKNSETMLPLRVQAYERMCLFLERINPGNLIMRLNAPEYNAKEFQQLLLREIREEYNHNLAQQIYMSNEVWGAVMNAKEEIVMSINQAAEALTEEDRSIVLAKRVFEQMATRKVDVVDFAIKSLKEEVRTLF